ncbi:unannotated protein [freshwater metagenome]|uniref:Unannotated protein n=1 Tax=freshwater metagenome TaxID=449393 RepID=A0A6J7EMF3_9ZZZZ|nr:redoxin domain-containing protein [Actinomycetota bacterium]
MKKIVALLSLLFIVGCGNSTPALKGEIVSCSTINTIADPAKTIDAECLDGGSGVNVAAIKGPAIINVWGSWCAPCKDELPYFVEFNRNQGGKVLLVGIDVEEKNAQDGRAFAIEQGMNWPNLYDRKGVTRKYFGMGVPVTWFIDSDGKVVHKKIGSIKSTDELRSLSKKYLGVS